MFCCALGTVIFTALALWRKRLRGLFTGRVTAPSALGAVLVIGLALAGSFLLIDHFGHAAFAGDMVEIDNGPLCRADLATDVKE